MKKRVLVALALTIPALAFAALVWAKTDAASQPTVQPSVELVAGFHDWNNAEDPVYEGGRSGCRRCHLPVFRSWEKTAHATALDKLPEENHNDPKCVKCHVTGYGKPGGFTSADATPELAGVGCEACHGPGSLYKDRDVMEDRDAAIAKGLVIPNEQTCLGCHNSESPQFPGSFNYEEMLAKGVHERK